MAKNTDWMPGPPDGNPGNVSELDSMPDRGMAGTAWGIPESAFTEPVEYIRE
jgi:hypothetical protein